MAGAGAEDPEHQVELLRQFQRAAMFRVAVADLTGRLPLMKVSDRLTDIAELIVQEALDLAWAADHGASRRARAVRRRRRCVPAGLIVVAYGKFGGIRARLRVGPRSRVPARLRAARSNGRPVRLPSRTACSSCGWCSALVHLLTVHSAAGRLYEVDTRLRPSGKGGLLAQSIDGFGEYQRSEAWTWEHQALLRARAVAGPPALRERFETLRVELLRSRAARHAARRRCARCASACAPSCRDRSRGEFDLKQDRGGIADIEFLAQYWALKWAERYAELVMFSDNIRQLESPGLRSTSCRRRRWTC